jgi:hypothetical protein
MILFRKHQPDRFLATDRRAFVRRNKSQFCRLIITVENTARLRISSASCAAVRTTTRRAEKTNRWIDIIVSIFIF